MGQAGSAGNHEAIRAEIIRRGGLVSFGDHVLRNRETGKAELGPVAEGLREALST